MKKLALLLAGIVFLLVSALHFYRYYNHIQVTFDHFSIPLSWSIYGGFLALVLAIFMFVARR